MCKFLVGVRRWLNLKKKPEKRENEMLWLLNGKQNFHLPEGQQKKQTKTKQPSNIHLKDRTIIRN